MNNKIENLRKIVKGSVYQSPEWKESIEKDGKKTNIISIEENGGLKASILAVEQEIATPLGKKKILFSEGTPLFLDNKSGIEILNKFREESKRYFYGLIRPTVINPQNDLFLSSGYKKVSDSTMLIDLSKSEQELFQSLEKKSARWGVKTAEKNALVFEEARNENEIRKFCNIYEKTAKDGGFKAKSIEFIYEIIKNKSGGLFLIKKKDQIIAGGLILIDFDYNILNLTASTEEGYKMQAMPFLYWNFILLSKEAGKKYFDLGGYDKNAKPGDKIYNINKFKENFGGTIAEQPHFATNWKYPSVRGLMKRFKMVKKLYKKQ